MPLEPSTQARFRLRSIFLIVSLMVALLPLGSLFFFRIYENMLVRQTEQELIAQAAVLGAEYRHEIKALLGRDAKHYGVYLPDYDPEQIDAYYTPVYPQIDLAEAEPLPSRPDGEVGEAPDDIALKTRAKFSKLLQEIQKTTLAGIIMLDYQGVAFSWKSDFGRSFAHLPEVQAAMQGHYKSVIRQRETDYPNPTIASISRGTGIRVFAAFPIIEGKRLWGIAYLSRTPQNILKHLYEEKNKVFLASLTILGVTLFIVLFTTYMVTRPIHRLIQRTKQVSGGDMSAAEPLRRPGTLEVEQLAESFADMAEALHERSEYIRAFATHVSHEFKTPLTGIHGATELLLEDMDNMPSEKREQFLTNIMADTDRLKRLVTRLLELARADSLTPTKEQAELLPLCKKLALRYQGHLDVKWELPSGQTAPMDAENLETIFTNLLDNAEQHGATEVTIRTQYSNNERVIAVADNGCGVSFANQEKIFVPFFTTQRETGGTGIGLGIIASLMEAHGGEVKLGKSEAGAVFELHFP